MSRPAGASPDDILEYQRKSRRDIVALERRVSFHDEKLDRCLQAQSALADRAQELEGHVNSSIACAISEALIELDATFSQKVEDLVARTKDMLSGAQQVPEASEDQISTHPSPVRAISVDRKVFTLSEQLAGLGSCIDESAATLSNELSIQRSQTGAIMQAIADSNNSLREDLRLGKISAGISPETFNQTIQELWQAIDELPKAIAEGRSPASQTPSRTPSLLPTRMQQMPLRQQVPVQQTAAGLQRGPSSPRADRSSPVRHMSPLPVAGGSLHASAGAALHSSSLEPAPAPSQQAAGGTGQQSPVARESLQHCASGLQQGPPSPRAARTSPVRQSSPPHQCRGAAAGACVQTVSPPRRSYQMRPGSQSTPPVPGPRSTLPSKQLVYAAGPPLAWARPTSPPRPVS